MKEMLYYLILTRTHILFNQPYIHFAVKQRITITLIKDY